MITIFNRKELTTAYSMKRQAEIRALLAQKKVAYTIKTINRKSPSAFASGSRARTGTYGERLEMSF